MTKKLIIIVFFLLSAPSAWAQTSSVSVENNVNTSNSTSGESESSVNTDIRIEQNGKVTTYSTDKNENVEVNVIDGVSEIKVDGEIIDESIQDVIESGSPSAEDDLELKKANDNRKENKNIFEVIETVIKSIFSLLV
jgi:hypothetical protein